MVCRKNRQLPTLFVLEENMMKHIWKQALALLLACGMAAGAAGCGEKKDKAESSAAESSTADSADSIEPVTELIRTT